MRRLLLLRHAKAEPAKPGGRDHDRILAERGRTDAARVGAYLVRHAFIPDKVLVSTSARTRETWTWLAGAFDDTPAAVGFDERLYEAPPQAILKTIRETPPDVGTLLVIGHNPGLKELAEMLVATGDIEARQRVREKFPTAALAAIQFAVDTWQGLRPTGGRLEHLVTPRSLETATD